MEKILKEFSNAKRILITGHINPDGDCVGAGLSLMLGLNKLNSKLPKEEQKIIRFILQDSPPHTTDFLAHFPLIEKYENVVTKYEFDLAFVLDSGAYDRIGLVTNLIKENTKIINIDHHVSNNSYGHINYLDTNISSTSEYIYKILEALNVEIDTDIGEAVYVGLVNDTGNFSYTNVSPKTFEVASKLREIGVNNEKIVREFYDKKSLPRLRMLGYAMENFEFFPEKELSFVYIPYSIFQKYEAKKEDSEGVVEALRSFEKAQVALFLRQEENGLIKGSFRSNGVDVNRIAAHFGGGGHIKAAGFTSDKNQETILKEILELL